MILAPASGWGCARCGTEVAPALLACPGCRSLRHAAELHRLAGEAEAAERAGDASSALARWREALVLLPEQAAQHAAILQRVNALVDAPAAAKASAPPASASNRGLIGTLVAIALLLLTKGKFVILFALTKGKLLLLGLTKVSTLGTMMLSFGVYWTMWGWKFALGFVLSIYVHEMGHVAALSRCGIAAGAPMFIPGIGAFVRLKQALRSEWEDAYVGLAGPVWGLGAALAAYGGFAATGEPFWAVIAKIGAMINLFNLIPVWQLDGARAFSAMSRAHRAAALVSLLLAWAVSREGLLLLPAMAAAVQLFRPPAREPDARSVLIFVTLVGALTALATLPVPGI